MKIKNAFSSFSVPDLKAAKNFYDGTLGLEAEETPEGLKITTVNLTVFVYESVKNKPADFTVLSFVVDDIDAAVEELAGKGVVMEQYPEFETDEKGIARGDGSVGPSAIAWFKDPAGNVLALLEE